MYNEKETEAGLLFSFGKEENMTLSFEFQLNYTGWKEISLPYERGFMKGTWNADMDCFQVQMIGSGSEKRTIYLDDLKLCQSMNPLPIYPKMSDRVKKLKRHTKRSAAWEYEINGVWRNRPIFLPKEITKEECEAFVQIEQSYLELCDEMDSSYSEKGFVTSLFGDDQVERRQKILEFWNEYHLKEEDGRITGKYIANSTRYARMMKELAYECQRTQERELVEIFRLAFLHLQDQNIYQPLRVCGIQPLGA